MVEPTIGPDGETSYLPKLELNCLSSYHQQIVRIFSEWGGSWHIVVGVDQTRAQALRQSIKVLQDLIGQAEKELAVALAEEKKPKDD